jgi:uncharacterized protein YdbL (DUF1318 family)
MTKMNDDWRVLVTLDDARHAAEIGEQIRGGKLEHELRTAAGERVVVSVDDDRVFLYAGSRSQADAAGAAVSTLAAQHGFSVRTDLRHWHPVAQQWEDPAAPLPQERKALSGELAELARQEDEQSQKLGYAEFEVRVQLPTRHETVAFAQQLQAQGILYLRRWHYLLIGAADQPAAEQLAESLKSQVPDGAEVTVEGTGKSAEAELPPNPFAVFGGLGV